MDNKYFLFAMKTISAVADALEDGKITREEVQDFALLMIKEVPKLFK